MVEIHIELDRFCKLKTYNDGLFLKKWTDGKYLFATEQESLKVACDKSKSIPKSCNPKIMLGNVEIYNKFKFNQWLSINSEEKLVTIICKNHDKIIDEALRYKFNNFKRIM